MLNRLSTVTLQQHVCGSMQHKEGGLRGVRAQWALAKSLTCACNANVWIMSRGPIWTSLPLQVPLSQSIRHTSGCGDSHLRPLSAVLGHMRRSGSQAPRQRHHPAPMLGRTTAAQPAAAALPTAAGAAMEHSGHIDVSNSRLDIYVWIGPRAVCCHLRMQ